MFILIVMGFVILLNLDIYFAVLKLFFITSLIIFSYFLHSLFWENLLARFGVSWNDSLIFVFFYSCFPPCSTFWEISTHITIQRFSGIFLFG